MASIGHNNYVPEVLKLRKSIYIVVVIVFGVGRDHGHSGRAHTYQGRYNIARLNAILSTL